MVMEVWSSFLDNVPLLGFDDGQYPIYEHCRKVTLTLIVFQFHISKYVHGAFSEFNCSLTFHTLPEDIVNFENFRLDTACVYLVVGYVNDYKVT